MHAVRNILGIIRVKEDLDFFPDIVFSAADSRLPVGIYMYLCVYIDIYVKIYTKYQCKMLNMTEPASVVSCCPSFVHGER